MAKKSRAIYLITWVDSHAPGESGPWFFEDEINHKEQTIKTVGYIIRETKRMVTIVSSKGSGINQVSGVMCIPKCAILKRRKIGKG